MERNKYTVFKARRYRDQADLEVVISAWLESLGLGGLESPGCRI